MRFFSSSVLSLNHHREGKGEKSISITIINKRKKEARQDQEWYTERRKRENPHLFFLSLKNQWIGWASEEVKGEEFIIFC